MGTEKKEGFLDGFFTSLGKELDDFVSGKVFDVVDGSVTTSKETDDNGNTGNRDTKRRRPDGTFIAIADSTAETRKADRSGKSKPSGNDAGRVEGDPKGSAAGDEPEDEPEAK